MPVISFQPTLEFARAQDRSDPLGVFRASYHIPLHEGKESIYFCGNSLGLQPKGTVEAMEQALQQWQEEGIKGWFGGNRPWMTHHQELRPALARIVGAHPDEVVAMNTLTVNLHLMLVSFYRPTASRFKIIIEAGAFPSDQYALDSQLRFHGLDPDTAIVEVSPRPGEVDLKTEDILEVIEKHGSETALVLFGGINYYSGQFFDLPAITRAAHRVGAYAGFDLAHAVGNLPLQLHDWDVDFSVWCSYKYLNSGPGGPGGAFIHQRHGQDPDLRRFAGWWGQKEEKRFLMERQFQPTPGAAGWQVSTVPVLNLIPHGVSLRLFDRAGMAALREKSERLTDFLFWHLDRLNEKFQQFRILTPREPGARGSQLSIYLSHEGRAVFDDLSRNGVICDWREDNLHHSGGGVIRIAPTAMYNTFEEVYRFIELLETYYSNHTRS